MRRKLPLYVERSVHQVQADRLDISSSFEQKMRSRGVITCAEGCASCCHHPLHISVVEGILLYRSLVGHGLWTPSFRAGLEKHAQMVTGLDIAVWLLSNIPCPVLDPKTKKCRAYDARPLSCRVTFATGDPHFCHPQRLGRATTIIGHREESEEFRRREAAVLRKHGLSHLTLPVGKAVLLAERICTGAIGLEETDQVFVREFLEDA